MTFKSLPKTTLLLAIVLSVPTVFAQSLSTDPAERARMEADASVGLGERFFDLAMSISHSMRMTKATLHAQSALLEAAYRKNPFEPRFIRLLAESRQQEGDIDGAIEAWKLYRGIKGKEDDRVAQLQLIDLYLGKLESNDAKIKYLKALLANAKLNDLVKAAVAVRAVPLLDQRSRLEAEAMVAEARRYYPLPEVTLYEWEYLPEDATEPQRFAALLNRLRANPTDTWALGKAADMLSAAGLTEPALNWYGILMDLHAMMGTSPAAQTFINSMSERYRAGETAVAADQVDQFIQQAPDLPDAWLLRCTIQRSDESALILKQTQQMFLSRLTVVCQRILADNTGGPTPAAAPAATLPAAPDTRPAAAIAPAAPSPAAAAPAASPATTQSASTMPADLPPPPLAEAVRQAKALNNPQFTLALVRSLGDLAWFELYFDHKSQAAAPWIAAIKELSPADDIDLRRLTGWYDLLTGSLNSASVVFTELQDKDPLCRLGLLQLQDIEKRPGAADLVGSKILSDPHSGVLGAILWQAVKGRGFKAAAPSANVAALQDQLAAFPKEWLEVGRNPKRFYTLRAEPITVGHRLGDPMIFTVTLQNSGHFDITIGPVGLIKPMLVFNAEIRGVESQFFSAIVIDRLMDRLVLHPGEGIQQIVRLDEGQLSEALRKRPSAALSVQAFVISNPNLRVEPVYCQAGGYVSVFSKMSSRIAADLKPEPARRKFFQALGVGSPREKMLDLELLSAYVRQAALPKATNTDRAFGQQFLEVIDKSRADVVPGVKTWASYLECVLMEGPQAQKVFDEMSASNAWESRMLALAAARFLPADAQKKLASKLALDPDQTVKAYATAVLEMIDSGAIAATQPAPAESTTQPASTQPAPTLPATTQPATPGVPLAPRQ